MSGGSFDYKYLTIDEYYVGHMEDPLLDEMMEDLSNLLKSLEWWKSGDILEECYRSIVQEFKNKWLTTDRALNEFNNQG